MKTTVSVKVTLTLCVLRMIERIRGEEMASVADHPFHLRLKARQHPQEMRVCPVSLLSVVKLSAATMCNYIVCMKEAETIMVYMC